MCGIVGVITSSVTAIERKIFKDLLFMDTLRGFHSTGLITREVQGDTYMFKRALAAPDFMHLPVPKKMMDASWKMAIGHNRAATRGKVNDENAHPFRHGDIVGCHNGTLTSCSNLEDHTKFEVDSDNIFYDMHKNGAENTIPKLRGAFVLSWYDKGADSFNLCRNSQRPMYYCWNKGKNFFAFASEEHMLRAAISGDRQGRGEYVVEEVRELKPGQWIAIDLKTLKATIKTLPLDQDPVKYSAGAGSSWKGASSNPKTHQPATTTQTQQTRNFSGGGTNGNGTSSKSNVIPLVHKPSNIRMSVAGWRDLKSVGGGEGYIITGSTAAGQKAECYIPKELHDLLCNPKAGALPSHITAEKVCSLLRNKQTVMILDGTQAYNLQYQEQEKKYLPKGKELPASSSPKTLHFGFNAESLTAPDFLARTKEGCCNCDKVPKLEDSKKLHWLDNENHLCNDCKLDYFESRIGIEYMTSGRPICFTYQ